MGLGTRRLDIQTEVIVWRDWPGVSKLLDVRTAD